MFRFILFFFGVIGRLLRRRQSLLLENLAFRQQVAVLKRKNSRSKLRRRSVLLDRSQSILVGVEEFPAVGETRNRRGVASSSISHLLATEIQSRSGWKKADFDRAPANNVPHRHGESHVGSIPHSR